MASPMPGTSAIFALTATWSHGCPVPLSIYLLSTAPSVLLIYFSILCNAHVLNSFGTFNIKSMLVNTALYFIHMVMIISNFKMIIIVEETLQLSNFDVKSWRKE